jgi:hypothetical protein
VTHSESLRVPCSLSHFSPLAPSLPFPKLALCFSPSLNPSFPLPVSIFVQLFPDSPSPLLALAFSFSPLPLPRSLSPFLWSVWTFFWSVWTPNIFVSCVFRTIQPYTHVFSPFPTQLSAVNAMMSAMTEYVNELFRFELSALHWTRIDGIVQGSPPFPRCYLGMSSDGQRVFVFGGWNHANRTLPGVLSMHIFHYCCCSPVAICCKQAIRSWILKYCVKLIALAYLRRTRRMRFLWIMLP